MIGFSGQPRAPRTAIVRRYEIRVRPRCCLQQTSTASAQKPRKTVDKRRRRNRLMRRRTLPSVSGRRRWAHATRSRTAVRGVRCWLAKLDSSVLPCDDVHTLLDQHKSLPLNMLQCLAQRSNRRYHASHQRYDTSYRHLHASSHCCDASTILGNASYRQCDTSSRLYEPSPLQDGRPNHQDNVSYRHSDASCHRVDASPYPRDASTDRGEACDYRFHASYRRQNASKCRLNASYHQDEPHLHRRKPVTHHAVATSSGSLCLSRLHGQNVGISTLAPLTGRWSQSRTSTITH